MTDPQRFPAACRRFLMELDELASSSADHPHVRECGSCATRLAATRRHVALFEHLSPLRLSEAASDEALAGIYERATQDLAEPIAPALEQALQPVEAAASDEALAGIYERATRDLAEPVAPALEQALRPVKAPADVAWQELPGSRVEEPLRRSLTPSRSPGWMWRRIRPVTQPEEGQRPVGLRLSVGLAAAALVVAGLWVQNPFAAPAGGTNPLIHVVFEDSLEPFDGSFSLDRCLEVGR